MSNTFHKEFRAEFQLRAIELISNTINPPIVNSEPISNFNFNISLESKVDQSKKLIFVIVSIEIKDELQKNTLGSIVVSCVYEIENFGEIISIDPTGKINLPLPLVETLNSISISTTRGVMFSSFKGTFLHNAFLPIIDPKSFQKKEVIN